MTDNEIRIAIAEKCGYKHEWLHGRKVPSQDFNLPDGDSLVWKTPDGGYFGDESGLPDYPNDLNAMHEAEKTLNPNEQNEYYEHSLREVTGYGLMSIRHQNTRKIVSADARQRCEALLRTWGLWKDK